MLQILYIYIYTHTHTHTHTHILDEIIPTLLHPEHSLGFGVWKTPNGQVNVCGKGVGIDIQDQVVHIASD
jgi:hypothetical protein